MRALVINAHGGLERVEYRNDVPEPQIRQPNEVRIRVRAAALNHLDLFVIGGLPNVSITTPWVLGADAMGEIESIGSAVRDVRVGDRVIVNPGISDRSCEYCLAGEQSLCVRFGILGEHHQGTLAEYIVVPASNVRRVAPEITDISAAAFTLATLTAWRMVVTRARVRAGDQVLIQGIGGGVALAALQICKALGATVWATSRSEEKLARARAIGADETIDSRADVAREVRARTGKRGVDVVIDSVGEATWAQSLGALARAGRLVTCGGTSGPMVQTDVRRLFWNQWSIMGSTMGNDAEFDAISAELSSGRLFPEIDRVFELSEGVQAFERLDHADQFGKIVVTI
ncbi:MAG: zinc-binding dehydrogenase [Gemmatimonadaceae bacterium]